MEVNKYAPYKKETTQDPVTIEEFVNEVKKLEMPFLHWMDFFSNFKKLPLPKEK